VNSIILHFLVLGISRLEFNVKFRLSDISCLECWELSIVSASAEVARRHCFSKCIILLHAVLSFLLHSATMLVTADDCWLSELCGCYGFNSASCPTATVWWDSGRNAPVRHKYCWYVYDHVNGARLRLWTAANNPPVDIWAWITWWNDIDRRKLLIRSTEHSGNPTSRVIS
jgi:hypothetical protein